jgi:hypothetical protein
MYRLLALCALLATPIHVVAGVQEVWWNITYVDNINPDNLHPRRVVGVNGSWPFVSTASTFEILLTQLQNSASATRL